MKTPKTPLVNIIVYRGNIVIYFDFTSKMSSVSSKSSSSSLESLNDNFSLNYCLQPWCTCGSCQKMETSTESICCREMLEINDEQFQGIYPLATNMASVFSFVTVFSYIYNIFSTVNSLFLHF